MFLGGEASQGQVRTVKSQVDVIHKGEVWGELRLVRQPARRAMERTEAGPESGLPVAKNVTPGWKVGGLIPSSPLKVAKAGFWKMFVYPGGQARPVNEERLGKAVL